MTDSLPPSEQNAEGATKRGGLFGLFRRPAAAPETQAPPVATAPMTATTVAEIETPAGVFSRIHKGLQRTGSALSAGLGNLLLGRKEIDAALMDELETRLLLADVGIDATSDILKELAARVARKELNDTNALYGALQDTLIAQLQPCEKALSMGDTKKPFVILVVGVNGVGKTTTIGKLARRYQQQGCNVMLAAGDTFRAAAVEQLQIWGERHNIPVIAQHTGADSASVIYDALQAAQSRGADLLIADTAGRLHNKSNLMEELKKVIRVMQKLDATAPHEILLVLDAGTGQNAIAQTREFLTAAPLTGLALTKLDGTAKGGIIFALARQFNLPVRFIGVGEKVDDLQPFKASDFVRALFDQQSTS